MSGIDLYFYQFLRVAKKYLNPKMKILYVVLIILQSYLVPIISSITFKTDYRAYVAFMQFYSMSIYTVIVLGIIVLHVNGIALFQDYFTLLVIALSCFLRTTLGGDFEILYRNYMNFLGITLLIYMMLNRGKIIVPSLKSFGVGVLWSIGTILVLAFLYAIIDPIHGSLPSSLSDYFANMFVFQFSFVTVIEEAVFRGLLFGFMILNGYEENKALLVQAVLFWGVHYMDITANPLMFFILVPLFTISVTLIIKKYKMLYLSIMVHLLVNVFARVIVAML